MKNFKSFLKALNESVDLNPENFQTVVQNLPPAHRFHGPDMFKAAIDGVSLGLKNQSIFNVELVKWKSVISSGYEAALDKVATEHYWTDFPREDIQDDSPFTTYDVNFSNVSINSIKKEIRNLEKAMKHWPDKISLILFMKMAKEMEPVVDAYKAVKPFIVKGRKPNPNAKPKFDAAASIKDKRLVSIFFERLLNGTRKKYEASIQKSYEALVVAGMKQVSNQKELYKKFGRDPLMRQMMIGVTANPSVKSWRNDKEALVLQPNWKEIIHGYVVRDTDITFASYTSKNSIKLGAILSLKGNLDNIKAIKIKITSGVLETRVRVIFKDGSRFDVLNKIVWVYTNTASFNRFPTTFHNVVMADGSKMGRPSEERMNTIFAVK